MGESALGTFHGSVQLWERTEGYLGLVLGQFGLGPCGKVGVNTAPLKLADKEPLNLHIFLDKSVVEIFANRRACLYRRFFPVREDSLGVALLASGGEATILSLEAWKKDPVPITGSSD